MTTIKYASIACNGCGMCSWTVRAMWRDEGAAGLRRKLRKNGWRRVPGTRVGDRNGKDYCPACAVDHPEAK